MLLKIELMEISLYYISGLNQDIEELFSVLSLFQDPLSATDIKSQNNIYLEISLQVYDIIFPPKIQKTKNLKR